PHLCACIQRCKVCDDVRVIRACGHKSAGRENAGHKAEPLPIIYLQFILDVLSNCHCK
ncbi:44061_t:CDS:1, partial [Gigaspora margarita]